MMNWRLLIKQGSAVTHSHVRAALSQDRGNGNLPQIGHAVR